MATPAIPRNPQIFPDKVSAPEDTDTVSRNGPLRSTFQDIADRISFLNTRNTFTTMSSSITGSATLTEWTEMTGSQFVQSLNVNDSLTFNLNMTQKVSSGYYKFAYGRVKVVDPLSGTWVSCDGINSVHRNRSKFYATVSGSHSISLEHRAQYAAPNGAIFWQLDTHLQRRS